jgi:PHP domain-containing protein
VLKGAIHIHSTYSDGEFSLPELRGLFTAEGCRFVCMTDHAEAFDEHSLAAYMEECSALSDAKFRFIHGLEYECEQRMHILGYGAEKLASTQDPQAVIRHIDAQDAISVIAHPKDTFFPWIESFETLPAGIETWNSKYDSRYAPRPGTFALLRRLQQRKPGMLAFYGQDLHWKKQFHELFVELNCTSNDAAQVLPALRRGEYSGIKGELSLPSSGNLPESLLSEFASQHRKSDRMRNIFKSGKRTLDRLGIKVPASVKAKLRGIF